MGCVIGDSASEERMGRVIGVQIYTWEHGCSREGVGMRAQVMDAFCVKRRDEVRTDVFTNLLMLLLQICYCCKFTEPTPSPEQINIINFTNNNV